MKGWLVPLLLALGGCIGPAGADDHAPATTLVGLCRAFTPESDFGPTTSHFLNLTIRNDGAQAYVFDQQDWTFFDAAGQQAFVHGWGNPAAPGHDSLTLRPGDESWWYFLAWTQGPDSSNLTHLRFQDGPLRALADVPLPPAQEGPCWGDFEWRGLYTSPPW